MIPKIIHFVHLGPEPFTPDPVWQYLNPNWEIKVWNEENVHELGLKPEDWKHDSYAGSSNLIRLFVIWEQGGCYFDTDFIPLKPLDSLLQYDAYIARQPSGPHIACNAAFGATARHPWVFRMLDAYKGRHFESPDVGCHIAEASLGDDVSVLVSDIFYPYSWNEESKPPTENTLAVHLWEGSWLKDKKL